MTLKCAHLRKNGRIDPNLCYDKETGSVKPVILFSSRTLNQMPPITLRNNIVDTRAHLLDVFFRRVALGYIRVFSVTARRVIEFGFLLQAVFVLLVFIHLHVTFVKSPVTCLNNLRSEFDSIQKSLKPLVNTENTNISYSSQNNISKSFWSLSHYSVLRIEVIRSPDPFYSLADSYAKEFHSTETGYRFELENDYSPESDESKNLEVHAPKRPHHSFTFFAGNIIPETQSIWNFLLSFPFVTYGRIKDTVSYIFNSMYQRYRKEQFTSFDEGVNHIPLYNSSFLNLGKVLSTFAHLVIEFLTIGIQFLRDISTRILISSDSVTRTDDSYIMEYALEYGFLRLSPQARKRLNVSVKLVVLDPETNPCFGNILSRFLMEEFLGYDDILIGSIKYLCATEGLTGYVVNVMSGQHYRLVVSQMSRSSCLPAALIMLLFTFCVSILLRYSSQQLVFVITDILQMFENNVPFGIPVAPFMTVILALIAMETIMSEFFGDSITAFYIILIVSICDHYEAVFCRTELSKQYWPRFFYLYHFGFYAYHYRFSGQFSGVALWVSWLFILHSMIYFFHHYELPNLLIDLEFRDFVSDDQVISQFHSQVSAAWLSHQSDTNSFGIESTNPSVNFDVHPDPVNTTTCSDDDVDDMGASDSNEKSNNSHSRTSETPVSSSSEMSS
ncbi:unnamed protein product [Heterobilharzia americana]|nr:unnamed protein product [Heterobilharzia americana]